jgi:hypothetical protein
LPLPLILPLPFLLVISKGTYFSTEIFSKNDIFLASKTPHTKHHKTPQLTINPPQNHHKLPSKNTRFLENPPQKTPVNPPQLPLRTTLRKIPKSNSNFSHLSR